MTDTAANLQPAKSVTAARSRVRFNGREYEVLGYLADGRAILRPPLGGVEEWVKVSDCEPA
ncbi:hypothetical protein GCM10009839_71240 [Catenulispora yoronensis]|uniref:Transposase n=1 Tax=Catenulispora yoronensis TaxID=450799 RepID=A0ABP5GS74_9ACTN